MTTERDFEHDYRKMRPTFENLANEVRYSIEELLRTAGVKVHGIYARAKSVDSFLEKVDRKQYSDPFAEMPDLAGVRIVCLFLSDLRVVTSLLEDHFHVLAKEDKVNERCGRSIWLYVNTL